MKLAELHCHTIYSNEQKKHGSTESFYNPEDVLIAAKDKGLSAIAITEHNSFTGSKIAQKLAKDFDIIVIPAEEFDTKEGEHILAYGIEKGIKPFRGAREIIKDIHSCGGIAIIAHPFDLVNGSPNLLELVEIVDGIEVVNFGAIANGKRALEFAKTNKIKTQIAGSDAHTTRLIGSAATVFPDECKTVSDYIKALKEGTVSPAPQISYAKALLIGAIDYAKRIPHRVGVGGKSYQGQR